MEVRLREMSAKAREIATYHRCPMCKNKHYSPHETLALGSKNADRIPRCPSCSAELESVAASGTDWSFKRGAGGGGGGGGGTGTNI